MFGQGFTHIPWETDLMEVALLTPTSLIGVRKVLPTDRVAVILPPQERQHPATEIACNFRKLDKYATFKENGIENGSVLIQYRTEVYDRQGQFRRKEQLTIDDLSPGVKQWLSNHRRC